jgi:hypothetical protein
MRLAVTDTALGDEARDEEQRDERDRKVDEEDRLPAHVLGEHAAEQHADGRPGAGDSPKDAERLVPFRALLERHQGDREDGRREDRTRCALREARRDEHAGARGQPRPERRGEEQRETDHEHPAPAEQVAGTAAEEQEAAERQRVARDDPLEVLRREAKVLLDRRQGDVHDRDVEDDHEVGDAEDGECLPAPGICVVFHRALLRSRLFR